MGILSKISEYKQKFREVQQNKSQVRNEQIAQEIRTLREQRIKLEGKANLERIRQQEKARINKAKLTTSKLNKFRTMASNLKKTIDKHQAKGKDIFGSSPKRDIFGVSNKPFSLQREEIKPKPKQIIIKIKQ